MILEKSRKNIPQRAAEVFLVFLTGAVLYFGTEVLFRGWSHWSMALCGGLCFLTIYRFNEAFPRLLVFTRALVGALIITALEFAFGCVFNLSLGMKIWDYSDLPYNLLGQVCLPFSVLWFLLSVPACALSTLIRKKVFLRNV